MALLLLFATIGMGLVYVSLRPSLGSSESCCLLTAFGFGTLLILGLAFEWLKKTPRA